MGSSGSQPPDPGDMWTIWCPKSPIWSSPCSASVTSGDDEEYGHNNKCQAIEVIGQDWSSEVVALFLEDWELGRVALSCHMAMDLLCQEMRDVCRRGELKVVCSAFSRVRRKRSRLVAFFPSKICRSADTLCLSGMSDSRCFKRCLCVLCF